MTIRSRPILLTVPLAIFVLACTSTTGPTTGGTTVPTGTAAASSAPSTATSTSATPSQAPPSLPSIAIPSLPSIAIPSLPSIDLPSIAIPSLPSIAIPSLPSIAIPSLPSIAIPSLPSIAIPSLPSIAIPSIDVPSFIPDPVLEGTMPTTAGGQTFQIQSASGAQAVDGLSSLSPELATVLSQSGATADNFSFAVARLPGGGDDPQVIGFRIAGADASALQQALVTVASGDTSFAPASVAGKSVLKGTPVAGTEGDTSYLYTAGDTVFAVTTSDETIAEELLLQLP